MAFNEKFSDIKPVDPATSEPGSINGFHDDLRRTFPGEWAGPAGAGGGVAVDYKTMSYKRMRANWKKAADFIEENEHDADKEDEVKLKRLELAEMKPFLYEKGLARYINKEGQNVSSSDEPNKRITGQYSVDVLQDIRELDPSNETEIKILDTVWAAWLQELRADKRGPDVGQKIVDTILAQTKDIQHDVRAREFFRTQVFPMFRGLYTYGALNKNFERALDFFDYVNGGYQMQPADGQSDLASRVRDLSDEARDKVVDVIRSATRSNILLVLNQDLGKEDADVYRNHGELALKRVGQGSVFQGETMEADKRRIELSLKAHFSIKDSDRMYRSSKEDYIAVQRFLTPGEMVEFLQMHSIKYGPKGVTHEQKYTDYAAMLVEIMNNPEYTDSAGNVQVIGEHIDDVEKYLAALVGSKVNASIARSIIETMIVLPDFDPDMPENPRDPNSVLNRIKYKIAHSITDPKTPIKSVAIRGGFRARYQRGDWTKRVPRNFDMIIGCYDPSDKQQKWGFGSYLQVNYGTENFFALNEAEMKERGCAVPLFDYVGRVKAASATEIQIVKDLSNEIKPIDFLNKMPEYIKMLGFNNIDMYKWLVMSPLMHAATQEVMGMVRNNVIETPFYVNKLESGAFNKAWTIWRNFVTKTPLMESMGQWTPRKYAAQIGIEFMRTNAELMDIMVNEGKFTLRKENILKRAVGGLTRREYVPELEGFETPFYLLEAWLCEHPEFRKYPAEAVRDFLEYAGITHHVRRDGRPHFYVNKDIKDARKYSGKFPQFEEMITSFLNKTAGTQGTSTNANETTVMPDVKTASDFEGVWWIAYTAMMQRSEHRWRGKSLLPWVRYANQRRVPFWMPYLENLTRYPASLLDSMGINSRHPRFGGLIRPFESFFGHGYYGGSMRDWDAIMNFGFKLRGLSAPGLSVADPEDPLSIDAARRIFALVKLVPTEDGNWRKLDPKDQPTEYEEAEKRGILVDGVQGYRGPESCVPLDWILRGEPFPSKFLDARKAALGGGEDVATRDITKVPFFGMGNVELLIMYHMSEFTYSRNARHAILEILDKKESEFHELEDHPIKKAWIGLKYDWMILRRKLLHLDKDAHFGLPDNAEEWFDNLLKWNPRRARLMIQEEMLYSDSPDVTHRNIANLHTMFEALHGIKKEKWLDEVGLAQTLIRMGATGWIDTTRRDNPRFEGAIQIDRARAFRVGENDKDRKGEGAEHGSIVNALGNIAKYGSNIDLLRVGLVTAAKSVPMVARTVFWGVTSAGLAYTPVYLGWELAINTIPALASWNPLIPTIGTLFGWFYLRQQETGDWWFNKNRARRTKQVWKGNAYDINHDADDTPVQEAAKLVVKQAEKYRDTRNKLTSEF